MTETRRPLRIGVKTERRGSALCLIVCIYSKRLGFEIEPRGQQFTYLWDTILTDRNQASVLAGGISA